MRYHDNAARIVHPLCPNTWCGLAFRLRCPGHASAHVHVLNRTQRWLARLVLRTSTTARTSCLSFEGDFSALLPDMGGSIHAGGPLASNVGGASCDSPGRHHSYLSHLLCQGVVSLWESCHASAIIRVPSIDDHQRHLSQSDSLPAMLTS